MSISLVGKLNDIVEERLTVVADVTRRLSGLRRGLWMSMLLNLVLLGVLYIEIQTGAVGLLVANAWREVIGLIP